MKKVSWIFVLMMVLAVPLMATEYRINSEAAFKLIIPRLAAGDVVNIADGQYTAWNITIPVNGTSKKPVIIKAASAGNVIFSGNSASTIFKLTGNWIILKGITFSTCTLTGTDGKSVPLIELSGTQNCTVTDCIFGNNVAKVQYTPLVVISGNGSANQVINCSFIANIDSQDVQVKVTENTVPTATLITKNIFRDKPRVKWKNGNGGECVQIGQDPILLGNKTAGATVAQNTFIRCDGENEVISNKSSGNRYIDNKFEQNDGELVMRGGHDCIISGNTFDGGTGGIRVNGTGHQIINNKINGIKTAIRLMYGMSKGKEETGFYVAASNCVIKGNEITKASVGILVGDSKNADWTGKFDTVRYPSRVMQDVAPFDNKVEGNVFVNTVEEVKVQ